MHLNDLMALQQGQGTERVEWNPVDDAYPWVISHRLFPMALLARDGQRQRWVSTIARELGAREDVVAKIVELEARHAG